MTTLLAFANGATEAATELVKDGKFGNAVDGIVEGGEFYVWLAYGVTWLFFVAYTGRLFIGRSAQ